MPNPRIFLSHAHADNALCDAYYAALRNTYGYDLWYDRMNLDVGTRLSDTIAGEIRSRQAFVVIFTPQSVGSRWVQLELATAIALRQQHARRLVVAVRAQPCELPSLPSDVISIDAVGRSADDVAEDLHRVLDVPGGGLSRRAVVVSTAVLAIAASLSGAFMLFHPRGTLPTSADRVLSVAWSPVAEQIAVGTRSGELQIWEASTRQILKRLTYVPAASPTTSSTAASVAPYPIAYVSWQDNGHVVAGSTKFDGAGVITWDLNGASVGKLLLPESDDLAVHTFAWRRGGARLALSWENSFGSNIFDYPSGESDGGYSGQFDVINALAWLADNIRVASGGDDKTVQIWNDTISDSQALVEYRGHTGTVRAVATSAVHSELIVSGGDDATVQVWNGTTGATQLVYRGHRVAVTCISWSPNGVYIASGSDDTTVQIWEVLTGTPVFTYSGHQASVVSVSWASDSTRLVSLSNDGVIQIWRIPAANGSE